MITPPPPPEDDNKGPQNNPVPAIIPWTVPGGKDMSPVTPVDYDEGTPGSLKILGAGTRYGS